MLRLYHAHRVVIRSEESDISSLNDPTTITYDQKRNQSSLDTLSVFDDEIDDPKILSRIYGCDSIVTDCSPKDLYSSTSMHNSTTLGMKNDLLMSIHSKSYNDKSFEIRAPSGNLGLIIDSPNFSTPVVHAVKERSPLQGIIRVGDLILSFNDQDSTKMLSSDLVALIHSTCNDKSRKFIVYRSE